MRYAVLAGVLAFALCAGVCGAEEMKGESASGASAVTQEDAVDAETGIEDERFDSRDDMDEPVTRVGVMSPGQSYDENTGFPDVVESDSSMEL